MKSLPSSGFNEIERCKRALVIELAIERGDFWRAVCDIRGRWGIEAKRQIPPDSFTRPPGIAHFPHDAPERVDNPHEGGWQEWEAWTSFANEWRQEIEGLYDKTIPEYSRLPDPELSRGWWSGFLSACVVYDPPETGLEEFAIFYPQIYVGIRNPEDRDREHPSLFAMSRPPIVYTRRAEDIESAYRDYAEELAIRVAETLKDNPDATIADTLREALQERDLDGPLEAEWIENPTRACIEIRPWHTEKDIISALRMISATQDRQNRKERGRDSRDPLRAIQCAILQDRSGWTYEQITEKFGWNPGSNTVGKYIKYGRALLEK